MKNEKLGCDEVEVIKRVITRIIYRTHIGPYTITSVYDEYGNLVDRGSS